MGLPIAVSYTFGTATSSIPLTNLDANFTTLVTSINSLGNGTYSFSALSSTGDATFTGTGQIKVPAGSTAQRSATPINGMFRYNSSLGIFEGYSNGAWSSVGGGAAANVFYVNSNTLSTNYSIASGNNAMSTGPITIATGVTVTVPSGSKWVVL